jgi:hypothetical protein
MRSMLLTMFTKFIHLQAVFQGFLILPGKIIDRLANRALHFDHVVLRHIMES